MSRITIIEGNTNEKDNVRTFFGKAEKGNDGISPEASITKSNGIATITIKDANGTTNASIEDGFDPIVRTSKTGNVATVEIEDAIGTHSFDINDGETYEVPTNSVVGWDSSDTIPNGYEDAGDYFENIYSTSEVRIGTYDGKPLYRKKVNVSSLPNNNTKTINIPDVDIVNCYGRAKPSSSTIYTHTIPYMNIDNFDNSIALSYTGAWITIKTKSDYSNYVGYLIVEYTLTTD